jgi:hypothetical protein
MKKITITKNFGNFDIVATTEVSDIQAEALISLGALYIFERQPSSGVEQKVFGPKLGWNKGQRGTSFKRPAEFKRSSMPYSKDLGELIAEAYERTPGKLGDTELSFSITSIVEHVGGADAPTKEGLALWEQVQGMPSGEFETACAKLGIDVDNYDDDKGVAACMAHLRRMKAEVSRQALGALR